MQAGAILRIVNEQEGSGGTSLRLYKSRQAPHDAGSSAGAWCHERPAEDALHIAVAAVHGLDFLLTWNCKHIANAMMRSAIERVCREAGYEPPVICTPEELTSDDQA